MVVPEDKVEIIVTEELTAPVMLSTDALIAEAVKSIPKLDRVKSELTLLMACYSFVGPDPTSPLLDGETVFAILEAGPNGWTLENALRAHTRVSQIVQANRVELQVNFRSRTTEDGSEEIALENIDAEAVQARFSAEITQQVGWKSVATALKTRAMNIVKARDLEVDLETDDRSALAKAAALVSKIVYVEDKSEPSEERENTWLKDSFLAGIADEIKKLAATESVLGMGPNVETMLKNTGMTPPYLTALVTTIIEVCNAQIVDVAVNTKGATEDSQTIMAEFEANVWISNIMAAVKTAYLS